MENIVVGTKRCKIRPLVKILCDDQALNSFRSTWTSFALELGVPNEIVVSLHNKLIQSRVSFYDTLLKVVTFWRHNCKGKSTLDILLYVLEQHGLVESAATIRANFSANPVNRVTSTARDTGTEDETRSRATFSIGSKITYRKTALLGIGSMGTKVYQGKFEGRRDIAVKRLDVDFFEYYNNEVDLLYASEGHQNIIRYICCETEEEYLYIALELCQASLDDYVLQNEKGQMFNNAEPINLLFQCTSGLNFIHNKGIVHRDIKPENILLLRSSENEIIVKISDFGIGKKTEKGRLSFAHSGKEKGTMGWQAPELLRLRENSRISNKIDVFSLGCLFYYVLTKGNHPFGDYDDRMVLQLNIRGSVLSSLCIEDDDRGILSLIKLMIHSEPNKRPLLNTVLKHPLFWDNEKLTTFFKDIRSVCERQKAAAQRFEDGCSAVFEDKWANHLSEHVLKDIIKGKYKADSIVDLVKAIRDKHTHYDELPIMAENEFGTKNLFITYWMRIFKNLLPYTWAIFESLKGEKTLKAYYDNDFDFQQN